MQEEAVVAYLELLAEHQYQETEVNGDLSRIVRLLDQIRARPIYRKPTEWGLNSVHSLSFDDAVSVRLNLNIYEDNTKLLGGKACVATELFPRLCICTIFYDAVVSMNQ